MNERLKQLAIRSAIASALTIGVATLAAADPVGGSVPAINTLTGVTYSSGISIVGATGLTAETIVSATINNNDENGWDLTVTSANEGLLFRGAGGAGRELLYTNITLVNTGGTLGTGLTDPSNTVRNIVTGANASGTPTAGETHFHTGSDFTTPGTATTATVDYAFELRISASANTSLLSGTYTDNITLTLNNDS